MRKKKYPNKNKKKPNRIDFRQNIDLKTHFKKVETGVKNGVFIFTNNLTIQEFAQSLQKPSAEVIKFLFLKGINCNLNTVLSEEQMGELCLEFGYDFKKEIQINEDNFLDNLIYQDAKKDLSHRPPIITIMGHVDHGKTTLLDTIRKTKTACFEVGNITQKIGAYQAQWNNNLITFFDTPGHEAFSRMRATGADLTDIIILVIAADDGLKPQTEEAIDLALFAKIPMVIFINKIDKPNVNLERIYTQLANKKVLVEEWGGNFPAVKGSALNNVGIDELLETVLLTAEILDLKANKNRIADGITIEAYLDKKEGIVADLLIKNGTLVLNDYVLIGDSYGKIKKMLDYQQKELTSASPATPVRIFGLNKIPKSGDKWIVIKDLNTLKNLAEKKKSNWKQKQLHETKQGGFNTKDQANNEVNVILKTDTYGSLEALVALLQNQKQADFKLNLIRTAVGIVTETDINFAQIANATIFCFNLKIPNQIQDYANASKIQLQSFQIIYEIQDAINQLLVKKNVPIWIEQKIGKVMIQQLWQHSAIGTIAGCKVLEGNIKRDALVNLFRNNKLLKANLKISSLKQHQENVSNVCAGKECGFVLENFNDLVVGDWCEVFEIIQQKDE